MIKRAMTNNSISNKDALRVQLKRTRALAFKNNAGHIHSSITKQLKRLCAYRSAKRIAVYVNFNHELPTQSIFTENAKRKKVSVIPLITSFRKKSMIFVHINKQMKKNRLGIMEPKSRKQISTKSLDIIFMPLLGFDKKGARIGMGGGYYDRELAFKKQQKRFKKPYLVGLAYEAQYLDSIQKEPWDVNLDALITEQTLYLFNSALR
jgi:5-formyltetrahydrofolate cyclo-ligase